MSEYSITCPSCSTEIEISEALTDNVRKSVRIEITKEMVDREKKLKKQLDDLEQQQQTIEREKTEIDNLVAKKLEVKQIELEEQLRSQIDKQFSDDISDLKQQLSDAEERIEVAQKNELALRKRERELEADKKAFELKIERQLAQERKKIESELQKALEDQHQLEVGDLQYKINTLKSQIEDLKKKADQGSQQAQGEVQELQLEQLLRSSFPSDSIKPVPTGTKGADIIQEIVDDLGNKCGTIVWESKRTKNFSNGWVDKLKTEQRRLKAEVSILFTRAMPSEINNFGQLNGIWVTNAQSAIGLVSAIRIQLIEINSIRLSHVGRGKKTELLYNYLAGHEFRGRVESIVEAFLSLRADLDHEKLAMQRIWAKREHQIMKVVDNTAGLYGDFQGIMGTSLQQIENLDLAAISQSTIDSGSLIENTNE